MPEDRLEDGKVKMLSEGELVSKQWKVRVCGLVTRRDGKQHMAVAQGEYIMKEAGPTSLDYDFFLGRRSSLYTNNHRGYPV